MVVLDYRILVDRQPVVGVHIVEIDQPGDIAGNAAVLSRDLDRHSLDQVAVQTAVFLNERGRLGLFDLAQDLVERFGGQVRVEAIECVAEAGGQQYLVVAEALGCGAFRGDVGAVPRGVAEGGQPFEGGGLYVALRELHPGAPRSSSAFDASEADLRTCSDCHWP